MDETLRFTFYRLPAWYPGKSTDQRKPSGCATTRHLSLQFKPQVIMPGGQPPGQKLGGVDDNKPQASGRLPGYALIFRHLWSLLARLAVFFCELEGIPQCVES